MAHLTEALAIKLRATTDLTNLVGTRIYPVIAPPDAPKPFVNYQIITQTFEHAMIADPRIFEPRVQLGAFSTSYSNARAIAAVLDDTLRDFTGYLSGSSSDGVNVQRSFIEFQADITHRDIEDFSHTHHIVQDYVMWYTTS